MYSTFSRILSVLHSLFITDHIYFNLPDEYYENNYYQVCGYFAVEPANKRNGYFARARWLWSGDLPDQSAVIGLT